MTSKNLNEQLKDLEEILFKNKTLKEILTRLEKSNLKNYYVGAGAINQTIFNYLHNFKIDANIKDYDIIYYDEDLSYEKENLVIKYIKELLKDIDVDVDIKNEARVHLWYNKKYNDNRKPYTSLEDAISRWGTTITCIGVRLEDGNLIVDAPYGLNDLFNMIIRPVKIDFKEEDYNKKVEKWKKNWPKLTIIPWKEEEL
ncbi:MAG TPA: nucleotidyltransferase family protein [Candidatus Onthousia faecipullorum]|uniref:Nucleotidyltransferase family protein n=1 Tax=Candidatus Onthousia faecipullorum TaxID=2840887 RepID=A0A9D1KAA2_9FIRM|nr:nucleotidyltransferase family protein [Candidatus Onthousia faecipullorum]